MMISMKESKIRDCLNQGNVNLWELRELALSQGGLMNADLRSVAWCHLVGIKPNSPSTSSKRLPVSSQEADLIRQDVGRSVLFHYDKQRKQQPFFLSSGESSSQNDVSPYQEQLALVLETVVSQPVQEDTSVDDTNKLHYYQGLHDVVGVFLYNLNYDTNLTCAIVGRVCLSHLRDALGQDLKTMTWFLQTVFLEPILDYVDQELYQYLIVDCQADLSNTVLSWLITWFTHDVHDEEVASRLVDAFLASHALLPMYFCVAVLIHPLNRNEILASECDPTMVHMAIRGLLSRISCDWRYDKEDGKKIKTQELLDDAITLMKLLPPDKILSLASFCDDSIGLDRAQSMFVMQMPPTWATASLSPSNGTTLSSDTMVKDGKAWYPLAMVACGVSDMSARTLKSRKNRLTIASQRLTPSLGLISDSPSVRKLCAKVLCDNLQQDFCFGFLPKLVCCKLFPNNCLAVGLSLLPRRGMLVAVYCWNRSGLFVMGVRQRTSRNKSRVKVMQVCHSRSVLLRCTFLMITFGAVFLQVLFHLTVNLVEFCLALFVFEYVDSMIVKLFER